MTETPYDPKPGDDLANGTLHLSIVEYKAVQRKAYLRGYYARQEEELTEAKARLQAIGG